MIFYFSATGNSEYVATRIAEATNTSIISISECAIEGKYSFKIGDNESIGIVSPTYHWGLPSIVCDFLKEVEFDSQKEPYIYFIATYGTTTGQVGHFVSQYLKEHGYSLNARFSVKMPDTWTPMFDLSDHRKVQKINKEAEEEIEEIFPLVMKATRGDFMKNTIPMLAVKLYYPTYERARKTKHFIVEDSCVGCGLCERKCPIQAIKIMDKKPVWVKDKCVMCLGCLHRCPKFSIQYGKHTKKHGQYLNPNVKL